MKAEETTNPINKPVTLKRPFAQLNLGAYPEDVQAAAAAGVVVTNSQIVVSDVYTAFNAYANTVTGETSEMTFAMNGIPGEDLMVDMDGDGTKEVYEYLALNYLLVGDMDSEKALTNVTFKWQTADGKENNPVAEFANVPVQRNYRTNIIGWLLTNPAQFDIVIDENFYGDINVPQSLFNLQKYAAEGGTVTLEENVTMPESEPSLEISNDFVLNINDNVDLTAGDASNYGIIVANGTTEINGDGDIHSQGGGIGVKNGASVVFNGGNLDVNSTSTSGRYLFYLEGAGSTATINGGNFDFNKTQNQKRAYIYAGEGTTVYVTGGTFGKASSRNDYKKGIYGKGTVIITGGTFGFDPTEWVATGYKAEKNGSVWTVVDNSIKFIDLGLTSGTLWADRNVKANSEEEVGQYYSWADITDPTPEADDGDLSWNWNNYDFWTDANGDGIATADEMTKYNATDGLVRIEAADDIATVEYGADCYIPTMDQINELRDECTWTWDDSKKGCTVTGPNGNSIFIPAGGYLRNTNTDKTHGIYCCIWSSDIDTNNLGNAQYLESNKDGKEVSSYLRHLGMPVRAVKNK